MEQENLRVRIRLLKALYNVPYKIYSEHLQIHKNSFYNWLKGYYTLGDDKFIALTNYVTILELQYKE